MISKLFHVSLDAGLSQDFIEPMILVAADTDPMRRNQEPSDDLPRRRPGCLHQRHQEVTGKHFSNMGQPRPLGLFIAQLFTRLIATNS